MHFESYLCFIILAMMEVGWVILIEREIMSHSLAPSEISRIFQLEIHGRSTNRKPVRIFKGGWMDPWTAESDQFFKKDCRDLRTADLVRIYKGDGWSHEGPEAMITDLVRFFKNVYRDPWPWTVESGHFFEKGYKDPRTGEPVQIHKRECRDPRTTDLVRFFKTYARTHTRSN